MRGLFTAAVAVEILWSLPSMALTQSEDSSAFPAGNGEGAGLPGGSVFNPRSSSPFKIHNNINELEFFWLIRVVFELKIISFSLGAQICRIFLASLGDKDWLLPFPIARNQL